MTTRVEAVRLYYSFHETFKFGWLTLNWYYGPPSYLAIKHDVLEPSTVYDCFASHEE